MGKRKVAIRSIQYQARKDLEKAFDRGWGEPRFARLVGLVDVELRKLGICDRRVGSHRRCALGMLNDRQACPGHLLSISSSSYPSCNVP